MAEYGIERLSKDLTLRGINVAIQRAEIDDAALRAGLVVKQHFSDNDRSASPFATKVRQGYDDLKATLLRSTDPEDSIWMTEPARLTRETKEAIFFIELSKTNPLRYIKLTNGMMFDLHTEWGRTAFRESISRAESESDRSSERQHRKKNWQAEGGAYHGGQRPFGYEGAKYEELRDATGEVLKDDKGRPVKGRLLNPGRVGTTIIETEAAVRREATSRIIAGEREMDVVRDFNARGISNGSGGKWRPGNFKAWLLRERDVAFDEFPGKGTRVHKGVKYRAVWDAIISREEYELIVAAFKIRSTSRRKTGSVEGRQYLLSGILRCAHTGAPMYGRRRQRRDGTFERRYITVPQTGYGEKIPGRKIARRADPLEEWVTEAVIEAFDTPEVAALLAPPEHGPRTKELVESRAMQQLHIHQLVTDYGAGVLTRDELVIAKQAAQQVLDEIEAELASIQATRTMAAIPAGQTLREFMATASLELRRQIIQLAVDYVIVKPGHPRGVTWCGYRFNPDHVEIVWKV